MADSTDAFTNDDSQTGGALNTTSASGAADRRTMPAWFIAGVLGVLIGGGGGFLLAMYGYGHRVKIITTPANAGENYGKPPTLGQMVPGGAEPESDAGGQRSLADLVGKIELLSRPDLKLALEFEPEQQTQLAAQLASIKQTETMSDEDAEKRVEAIEALLQPEQKATLDAIALPRRQGGGGLTPGGASASSPPEGNPFAQDETNQKRLDDLIGRLPAPAADESAKAP
jgi:hypothetical protein